MRLRSRAPVRGLGLDATGRRIGWIALRVAFGSLLVWVVALGVGFASVPNIGPSAVTADHATYMAAVHRWLDGGSFYHPYQLAGPYEIRMTEILYPPTILPLLVVFAFLPDVLWWLVPIAIVAAVTIHWRPSLLGWTLVLACMAVPITFESLAYGNPGIWIAAFVALGTVYRLARDPGGPQANPGAIHAAGHPPAVLVDRDRGARHRLVGLPPALGRYLTVLAECPRPRSSPLYSLNQAPLLLLPLAAWACRGRRDPSLRSAWRSVGRTTSSRFSDLRLKGNQS